MNPIIILSVGACFAQNMRQPLISGVSAAVVDTCFDFIFAVDIFLRFMVCPSKRAFFCDAYNVIDVAAVFPFLLVRIAMGFVLPRPEDLNETDTVSLVAVSLLLNVITIPRFLKFLRRFEKFHLIIYAFQEVLDVLPVLLYTLLIIAIIFSSLLMIVERTNTYWQNSLPMAFWFSIVTITTLGYGDVLPETDVCRAMTMVFIIIGVIYMAIPIGIIGSAFDKAWDRRHALLITHWTRERFLQFGFTPGSIPILFRRYGSNKSDGVTLAKFQRMMAATNIGIAENRIVDLFEYLDNSKRGRVNDRNFVWGIFKDSFHDVYGDGGEDLPTGEQSGTMTDFLGGFRPERSERGELSAKF